MQILSKWTWKSKLSFVFKVETEMHHGVILISNSTSKLLFISLWHVLFEIDYEGVRWADIIDNTKEAGRDVSTMVDGTFITHHVSSLKLSIFNVH